MPTLNHLSLHVRDLDRSVTFYRQVFGLEEVRRLSARSALLGNPEGDELTLAESSSDRVGDLGGVAHFGFLAPDAAELDRALAVVPAAGGRIVEAGTHRSGRRFAMVTDPDGYLIEI